MPKKQKQTKVSQKQKQSQAGHLPDRITKRSVPLERGEISQKTSLVVNVGANKKSKTTRRPRVAQAASGASKQPISVVLGGATMNLPPPPTQEYNMLLQQIEALKRQQASSGSLIPRMATNDLLNRVTQTNPLTMRSTNTQTELLNPFEGLMEKQVETATNIDPYDNDGIKHSHIDQDFIRRTDIEKMGQNFSGLTDKIGLTEDVEDISQLNKYDSDAVETANRLVDEIAMKELKRQVLGKNWERFVRKAKENESYLTPRVKVFEPDLEKPLSIEQIQTGDPLEYIYNKKNRASRATSNLIDSIGKLSSSKKPKLKEV